MKETVFAKILRGEIPSHRVYEDEKVLAFLDVGPLSRGHLLVIPKEPAETLDELSDESAAAVGRVLPRLARALMKVTGTKAYNVLPKPNELEGLGVGWRPSQLDSQAGAALAEELRAALG
jgi:histidine triad (HIT) family protein